MSEKNEVINNQYISWATLIDIDSDGDLDLVVSSWDFFTDEHDPAIVMLNDGTGAFSFSDEFMHPMATAGSQHWPLVADFNQDERDDFYFFGIGNEGGQTSDTWWTGTNHQLFLQQEGLGLVDVSSVSLADPRRNAAHSAAIGDIDGDGDIDIFNTGMKLRVDLLQMNGWQGLGSHFLMNQGGAGVFTPDTSRLPDFFSPGSLDQLHNEQDAVLVDIDRDGDLDLLLTWSDVDFYPEMFPPGQIPDPAFHILLNDGTGAFTVAEAGLVPPLNPSENHYAHRLSIADVNNDGWPDVFINTHTHSLESGSLQLILNNGDGSFSNATENIKLDSPWWSPDDGPDYEPNGTVLRAFTEDFNGDAWPDVLTLGSGIKNKLFFNNGDGSFQEVTSILGDFPDQPSSQIDVGDIDGDGDIDIVAPLVCSLELCPGLAIVRNSKPYMPATPPPLPVKPDLVTPANSAVDPGTTFAWQHVTGAQTYIIQISKSSSFLEFDSTDLELEGLTGNSIDVSRLVDLAGFDGLQTDNRYYWRVAPKNYAGQGAWSETRNFVLGEFVEFNIDAGHAGAWYNPDTSGQGQLIDIEPEGQFMFLAWFAYTDADSEHPNEQHWLTAQGNYSGNTAVLPVYETLGGKFDDPTETNSMLVGSIELKFNDCNTGQATYSIDSWGTSGGFPLIRAIPDSGTVCLASSGDNDAATSLEQNDGWDGVWFDPATAGQGFLIDSEPKAAGDDFIFVAWFTFGEGNASGQRWLTAQGPLIDSRAEIPVYETTGGSFNDPTPVNSEAIGSMSIEFIDCKNARVSYDLTDQALSGSIDIVRAIPGTEALCESLAESD